MPLYVYECQSCGRLEEAYRTVDDRDIPPDCHGPMKRKIVPTMIAPVLGGGNFPGYKCPITDEFVTSRKRRREIIAENNIIEKG